MSDDVQLPSAEPAQSSDNVTCRLCRRQFAKYTCPTCNVPYCSLICFRSEAHSNCSETFYKKEIEADIHAQPTKSAEERQKMLELLKKFEEQSASTDAANPGALTELEGDGDEDDDDEEADEEESRGDDLARRLEGVNLESATPDMLWSVLSPEERTKFMKALEDPTSELAQQLLASEELEKGIRAPWWEASTVSDEDEEDEQEHPRLSKQYGKKPEMVLQVPKAMVKPAPHLLLFNMVAICITYAYVTRHLATSPLCSLTPEDVDYHSAKKLISQLVPFLTDRKSTTVHESINSVITDIWSRFDLGKLTPDLFALLLRDTAFLLKPHRVTQLSSTPSSPGVIDPSTHANSTPILVLSDLSGLFASPEKENSTKPNHTKQKLLFYAAQMLSTPSLLLEAVANDVAARARMFEEEGKAALVQAKTGSEQAPRVAESENAASENRRMVEEL